MADLSNVNEEFLSRIREQQKAQREGSEMAYIGWAYTLLLNLEKGIAPVKSFHVDQNQTWEVEFFEHEQVKDESVPDN